MKKISIMTAGNPGLRNPGMLTVDFAAHALLVDIATEARVTWYSSYPTNRVSVKPRRYISPSEVPFQVRAVEASSKDFTDADIIIYWGDFLQARHYIVYEAAPRLVESGMFSSQETAVNELMRILLLADSNEAVRGKVIINGSTIIHNRQSDYSSLDYGQPFQKLISEANLVLMRDPLSAAKVAHFRSQPVQPWQGVDAALLLSDSFVDTLPTTAWLDALEDKKRIGVFLGGRTIAPSEQLLSFVNALAEALKLELDWLPWFGFDFPTHMPAAVQAKHPIAALRFRQTRRSTEKFMRRCEDYSFGDLLHALRRYRVIVTDTYHVCVNAWRAGTPAICISASRPLGSSEISTLSLGDIKKLALYQMYDATDFYIETDSLRDAISIESSIETVTQSIQNEAICANVVHRMQKHASDVRNVLRDTINGLLNR